MHGSVSRGAAVMTDFDDDFTDMPPPGRGLAAAVLVGALGAALACAVWVVAAVVTWP